VRGIAAIACGLLLGIAMAAGAHPLAPALFEVRELGEGEVEVRWKRSLLAPSGVELLPELPAGCEATGEPRGERDATSATLIWRAQCPGMGLAGETLLVRGLEGSGIDVLVRVVLADGRVVRAVLSGGAASTRIPERAEPLAVVGDYTELGVGHILSGPDHLLFVLALVLLVHGRRRLVWTVSAFTVGHSITLSLAVLGFVRFPSGLVEVAIAASIFVLAVELTRPEGAGLRSRPWILAGGFGLLHGLGFAGALSQAGLPAEEIPLALFAFNLGIEAGQLLFVFAVLALRFALRDAFARAPGWLRRVPAYAIGSLAIYWCLDRATLALGMG
jgi:hydrogenase/urease accessory protein HupE